jgi:hypothetical protein
MFPLACQRLLNGGGIERRLEHRLAGLIARASVGLRNGRKIQQQTRTGK